jgi:polysaccharide deacetylase 2 family uncharacterized protein YibQ
MDTVARILKSLEHSPNLTDDAAWRREPPPKAAAGEVVASFSVPAVSMVLGQLEPIDRSPAEVARSDAPESVPVPPLLQARPAEPPEAAVPQRVFRSAEPSEADATLPPWRRYAGLSEAGAMPPMIAIVVDDLGHDPKDVERAIALDPSLTLSFLPFTRRAPALARAAYLAGHEIMIHFPMEPDEPNEDPGVGALLLDLPDVELRRRLMDGLSRIEGVVGVNNHMGSRFTSDQAAMALVLTEIEAQGLLYLDSLTTPKTVGPVLADALGLPFAMRDVFLDDKPGEAEVLAELEHLERIAASNGMAIGIGHPYDSTYRALAKWLPEARRRGISIVPISAIVARQCGCGPAELAQASGLIE